MKFAKGALKKLGDQEDTLTQLQNQVHALGAEAPKKIKDDLGKNIAKCSVLKDALNATVAKKVQAAAYGSGDYAKTKKDTEAFELNWTKEDWIGKRAKKVITVLNA